MIEVRTILSEFEAAVAGITLPASFDPATPPAFQTVKQYDIQAELKKALEELLAFKDRVALILVEGVGYTNRYDGRLLLIERSIDVTVLVSDRNWGNRQIVLKGNDSTPGIQRLQELLISAVVGELSAGAVVLPGRGDLFALVGPERDNNPGRLAWSQEFSIRAGVTRRTLSRSAV